MSEWKQYRRKDSFFLEFRPYISGESLDPRVSLSEADKLRGSPKVGDMIGRNPQQPDDQWLVNEEYFKQRYEEKPK